MQDPGLQRGTHQGTRCASMENGHLILRASMDSLTPALVLPVISLPLFAYAIGFPVMSQLMQPLAQETRHDLRKGRSGGPPSLRTITPARATKRTRINKLAALPSTFGSMPGCSAGRYGLDDHENLVADYVCQMALGAHEPVARRVRWSVAFCSIC